MPYNPNANWTAAMTRVRSDIYYAVIEGITTKHFSTGPVKSPAVTKKQVLSLPNSFGQKISQLDGRATMTLTGIVLTDVADEITDLVSTEKASPLLDTLINKRVEIFSGTTDLVEADYARIAIGQINSVEMVDDTTFRFNLVDLKRHARDEICTNAEANGTKFNATLSADVNVGATTLPVNAALAGMRAGDKIFIGPSTHGSYLGGEEKAELRLDSDSSSLYLEQPITKSYKAGNVVRWASTIVEGNPLNLIYAFWTGDFSNGSFPILTKLGFPTGLGLAAADIDTADLIQERDSYYAEAIYRAELKDPTPGFRFMEQKLFRFLGYPRVKISGKLSFRVFRPWHVAEAAAGLPQIIEGDVHDWGWRRALDLHVNRVRLGVDFDLGADRAVRIATEENTSDQTATKETVTMEDEETLLQSAFGQGTRIAEDLGAEILRRQRIPPLQISITSDLSLRRLEIGETPELTHSRIPDPKTGTRGMIKRRLEIVERTEECDGNRALLILQDAGFTRPIFISPDAGGSDDYSTASDADKEYFFIPPDAGDFADGKPPYEI